MLELQEVPEPVAGEGELLIDVVSSGVNMADAASTRGQYAASPPPPFIPGLEVAGRDQDGRPVLAVVASGGYAERVVADRRLVFSAAELDLENAGGSLLVTLTAFFALAQVARIRPGESVLITAAAGGLGATCIQVARALAAGRITAVAGTEPKREFARRQGADTAIGYEDEFPAVDVVIETVGGEVFDRCLAATRHLGRVVPLGASAGVPPSIPDWNQLRRRNVAVMPFSFGMYRGAHPELVAETAADAWGMLRSGQVKPPVTRTLPLAEAAQAHLLLTSRQTMGKVLLRG